MPVTKNRDAYRRYTTFESTQTRFRQYAYDEKKQDQTFVFKKVAHACAASKYELGDILDDFGLLLGRHRHKPLRKAHFA
jgi:hypothetical protein